MKHGRGVITTLVIIVVFGGGGALIGFRLAATAKDGGNGKVSLGFAEPPVLKAALDVNGTREEVPTAKVEVADQPTSVRLTGTLTADEKSDVASTANGIVEEVSIERGSLVNKGDVLVKVDPTDVQNAIAEATSATGELKAALGWTDTKQSYNVDEQPGVQVAKAALDLATANYNRFKSLFEQKAVSKSVYDQASTEYESAQQRHQQALRQTRQLYQSYQTAQARLQTLHKALADTTIDAPFSGWVAEKYVSEGERVTTNPMGSGAKICTLVKIDPLRLALTVPQQQSGVVREGQTVQFNVDSIPDRRFTGTIKYIGTSVESMSRSLMVEALVPNPDHALRPGLFATAELQLGEKKMEISVPASAVVKQADVAKVYVVRNGKAMEQVVSVGESRNNRVYIASGLTNEDVVVTAPERVKDGDTIN